MVGDVSVMAQSSGSDLGSYLPLVFLLALGAIFAGVSATLGALVGPKRFNRAKLEAYECGIEPSPQPVVGGGRVPVAYYLTAMLFILFDIEMVFLYPFAVSADALGVFGLVEIVLFIATVGFAYAYVWRRGGLDWN
jgi:NADH-quinone oxidoreductase subunit A